MAINIDWAEAGWIESFNTFQTIYILQSKKLEFSCSFPSLSCSFWLLYYLLHATANVQGKTSAPHLSARAFGTSTVCRLSCYRHCFKIAGEDDCAVHWSSEEISFLSTFEVLHTFIANFLEAFACFIIFFFQKLHVLSKTGQWPSMHIAVMQHPKIPLHFSVSCV